jgi:protease I
MTRDKILLITGDAGESFEVLYAKQRLTEAGFQALIAAPIVKPLNLVIHDFEPGWDTYIERKGYLVQADLSFDQVNPEEYLAVLCIGGRAPEYLRNNKKVIDLVRHFNRPDKYVFAICHGIQILVTAGLVNKKTVTCYEHVRFEVESCGGHYVDHSEAIRDGNMVTGKTWQSHPEFYALIMQCLGQTTVVVTDNALAN